jgi:hypothetical protein
MLANPAASKSCHQTLEAALRAPASGMLRSQALCAASDTLIFLPLASHTLG